MRICIRACFPARLFLALTLAAAACLADPSRSAQPPKEMIELARLGNEANYNLDYEKAREYFEAIRQKWPSHPAGDLYLANVIWLEHLYRIRRLQTGIYRDESFYSGFEGSKESGEKGDLVDPRVDRQFRELIGTAKAKALDLVNSDSRDPYARYYLGAIYSISGAYEASTARRFWAALRNGSRGIDAHQQVLKLKPDYWDALLSIGVYEYLIGNLPIAIKTIAALGGIRGSKEKGIADLVRIIERGSANADDARVMLVGIYQHENQAGKALELLNQLAGKYPRNYLFGLERASALSLLGKSEECIAAFDGMTSSALAGSPAKRSLDLIYFQYGESLFRLKLYDKAVQQFSQAAELPGAESTVVTRSILRAAQTLDLLGKREDAKRGYQKVLARQNVYDVHEQARRGLAKPFVATP